MDRELYMFHTICLRRVESDRFIVILLLIESDLNQAMLDVTHFRL